MYVGSCLNRSGGQILVDVLDEIYALRAELAQLDVPPHHLPFDDKFCLPFDIPSQNGRVLCRVFVFRGRVFICWLELVESRLYLGASHCILSL